MTGALDPGQLVAQLPYALGFYPTSETVVVVTDPDKRRLWDFSPDSKAFDVAAHIAKDNPDPLQSRVTALVYASRVDLTAEIDANDLATALQAYFSHVDSPIVVTPDGWRHAVDCTHGCCPPDVAVNSASLPPRLAREAATTWPTPMASRSNLVGYFSPDPMQRTLVAAARTSAALQLRAAVLATTPPAWRHTATEQAWTFLVAARHGSPISTARTLLQLQDTYVSDAILMRTLHGPQPTAADRALVALRDLCRSAPDDLAPAPLSTWAHAAASRGDTPRALAAIHRAQQISPRHQATSVLRRLLIDGVDPHELAAVRLPEDALLNTPASVSSAVVSTAPGANGPPPPPSTGPLPPTSGRSL